MAAFRIVVAGWGVFVDIQSPLTNNDRHAFIEELKVACARMASMERRGVLLDLRRVDVVGDPDERVRAYVGITRVLGARRIAMVVSSSDAAERMTAALDAGGTLENSRVLITGIGVQNALTPALRWVDSGTDVFDPDKPSEFEQESP